MSTARDVGRALQRGTFPTGPAGNVLRRVLEVAIDGVSKLPSAKTTAARHLARKGDVDEAIDAIIAQHISMAGAQGFVTNIGGLLSQIVTAPANLTGVAVVQIRMVAAIAHLRGYDVNDPRVRTAMVMCLLGEDEVERLLQAGQLPTIPMAIATAPVFDPSLDAMVTDKVMADLLARMGGKRLGVLVTKRIPLLGGGVGAALDGFTTHSIGTYAREQFTNRRRLSS